MLLRENPNEEQYNIFLLEDENNNEKST